MRKTFFIFNLHANANARLSLRKIPSHALSRLPQVSCCVSIKSFESVASNRVSSYR